MWELDFEECQILLKFNFRFKMHSIIYCFCWLYALDFWGMCWPLGYMLHFPLEWRTQAHTPEVQHIHPAKTENCRMNLKTIKIVVWKRLYAVKFNINAKTCLLTHYWLFLLKYSFPSQGMPWHHWLLRPYTSVWTIWELYLGECQILMKFNFSFNMHSIILRFCWVYALNYWGMCLAASFKWEL